MPLDGRLSQSAKLYATYLFPPLRRLPTEVILIWGTHPASPPTSLERCAVCLDQAEHRDGYPHRQTARAKDEPIP